MTRPPIRIASRRRHLKGSRVEVASSLALATALQLGLACSSEQDATSLTPSLETNAGPEAPGVQTPEAAEAEFLRKAEGTLSDDERQRLDDILLAMDVDPQQASFVGRMVLVDDIYLDADDLLVTADDTTEKGRVLSQKLFVRLCNLDRKKKCTSDQACGASGPCVNVLSTGLDEFQVAPLTFTDMTHCASIVHCPAEATSCSSGRCVGTVTFWRPKIDGNVAYVIPNISFLKTAFTTALNNIGAASGSDCVGTNLVVLTEAEWAALGPGQASTPAVFVRYGAPPPPPPPGEPAAGGVCPTNNPDQTLTDYPRGCALFPRFGRLTIGGTSSDYMVPGPRMGLNNTKVKSSDMSTSVEIITHEVLHTLGIAHSSGNSSTAVTVPGTAIGGQPSIMHGFGDTDYSPVLSSDDKAVIAKLYGPRQGHCGYLHQYVYIPPN